MIFGIENWLWKSNFGTFWQLVTNPNLKIITFEYADYLAKIFLTLYPPFENSTTRTAIMLSNNYSTVLDKKVVLQNKQKHYKKKLRNNSVIILIKREELKWIIDICQLTYIISSMKFFTQFRLDVVKKNWCVGRWRFNY